MQRSARGIPVLISMAIALLIPQVVEAYRCSEPSPSARQNIALFRPVEPRQLSQEEHRMLSEYFKLLTGVWTGESSGTICVGNSANPRARNVLESVKAKAELNSPGILQITAELYRFNDRVSHQERLRLVLTDNRLRINENTPEGDIEILELKPGNITVLVKNRQPGAVVGENRRANIVREYTRTLRIQGRQQLQVEQAMYTNGELSSWSIWHLKRKIRY